VKSVEARQAEVEQWLRDTADAVDSNPTGPENVKDVALSALGAVRVA
jgi:hypothetical protein